MDRLEAMRAFVTALDEGSLAAAGRKLGRSPAAMTRAISALESQIGRPLFERTTRIVRLTEAGRHYSEIARRILAELEELNLFVEGARADPGGVLRITAPVFAGSEILRPCVDSFLDTYPQVRAQLLLLDRVVNLIEEGMDIALRIAHLPDSSLMAVQLGKVRRVVCASPAYLARHPDIHKPSDLAAHQTITLAESRQADHWSFPSRAAGAGGRVVRLTPRMSVNNIAAAKGSALDGNGIVRLFSYQVAEEVRAGQLVILLDAFEAAPLPVHLIAPKERLAIAKTRAFMDFALPLLRAAFTAKSIG